VWLLPTAVQNDRHPTLELSSSGSKLSADGSVSDPESDSGARNTLADSIDKSRSTSFSKELGDNTWCEGKRDEVSYSHGSSVTPHTRTGAGALAMGAKAGRDGVTTAAASTDR
jgi:hypothetical protein